MSILGDQLELSARVSRAKNNTLVVTCSGPGGADVAVGRQKGGAAVLLGLKNGGKGSYTVTGTGTELGVEVAATTRVTRDGQPLGSIVGEGTSARIESAGGSVLAHVNPFRGERADAAWPHPLTSPDGKQLGTLTLMRTMQAWSLQAFGYWAATWEMTGLGLKTPSAGAVLQLSAPVSDILADLLVAALVDVTTLPRGYVATT
ncbi:MAG TPA: hypothetical protein VG899_05525 [Mycobacteriales bacterium]|nr:hypothetical protein [Mycobacteriales bacterium]